MGNRPMRQSDLTRLAVPYAGFDGTAPGPGPAAALGVDVPHWTRLEAAILDDISVKPPYGIQWWAPSPGTSRRILISDHLYACTHSVTDNLVEAGLHRLDFLDYAEQEDTRFANAVQM